MLQFALTTVRSGGATDGRLLPVVVVLIEFGLGEGGRGGRGRGGERGGAGTIYVRLLHTHTYTPHAHTAYTHIHTCIYHRQN